MLPREIDTVMSHDLADIVLGHPSSADLIPKASQRLWTLNPDPMASRAFSHL